MLERCQLEPLHPDQCQRQQPGTGTGSRPRRPRYAPGRTRRSRSHRQCRQKARAAAHNAPPPWPFSFAPPSRLPPARPAGSAARHALGVVPPPDDHASAPRPQQIAPPTCTACQQQTGTGTGTSAAPMTPQPISCTACPLPAHLHRQTSQQQPTPTACTHQQQRTPQPCRLPAAADQHHPRPPNGPKPAHRGPLPEGSDSLPTRHIDYAV